jgi:hypothetical protein
MPQHTFGEEHPSTKGFHGLFSMRFKYFHDYLVERLNLATRILKELYIYPFLRRIFGGIPCVSMNLAHGFGFLCLLWEEHSTLHALDCYTFIALMRGCMVVMHMDLCSLHIV